MSLLFLSHLLWWLVIFCFYNFLVTSSLATSLTTDRSHIFDYSFREFNNYKMRILMICIFFQSIEKYMWCSFFPDYLQFVEVSAAIVDVSSWLAKLTPDNDYFLYRRVSISIASFTLLLVHYHNLSRGWPPLRVWGSTHTVACRSGRRAPPPPHALYMEMSIQ